MNKESVLFLCLEFQESGDVAQACAEGVTGSPPSAQWTRGRVTGSLGKKDNGKQQPSRPRGELSRWQPARQVVSDSRSVQLFATPWTVAYQAPLSTEFSRQEYWSGRLLLFNPELGLKMGFPGDLVLKKICLPMQEMQV